ncbi:MAG: putative 3-hydroxybutyryl-CoA dehydrogenase [Promethearchaeota archaeon]|nr:MAG: putative 3-hydroxybutyryl-CoA dehydrogenase [Candidatus Lokiarchaeota archaeon]
MNHNLPIEYVAIVGVGTMGQEIAQVTLMGGYHVTLYDISEESLAKAESFIFQNLTKLEEKGKLHAETSVRDLLANVKKETSLEDAVKQADMVIEAIPEIMELKQNLFRKLGDLTSEHTILASNTSNMKITEIAQKSNKADKIVGIHFFTPIVILPAIEVIKGEHTSVKTMEIAKKFAESLPCLRGKRKIILIEKETPGFIVNRLTGVSLAYVMWLVEQALEDNIPYEQIDADAIAMQGGGLGPLAKLDVLGLDVIIHSFNYYAGTLSKELTAPDFLKDLVNSGKLGKKTGEGFYEWTEDGRPDADFSQKADMFNPELYMAIQLNEGCRLLEESVAQGYKEVDDAIVAAMNMPGPFSAGKRNYKKWVQMLEEFAEKSEMSYFRPCELLKSGKFLEMKK